MAATFRRRSPCSASCSLAQPPSANPSPARLGFRVPTLLTGRWCRALNPPLSACACRYIERTIGGEAFSVGENFLDLRWNDGDLDYNQDEGAARSRSCLAHAEQRLKLGAPADPAAGAACTGAARTDFSQRLMWRFSCYPLPLSCSAAAAGGLLRRVQVLHHLRFPHQGHPAGKGPGRGRWGLHNELSSSYPCCS